MTLTTGAGTLSVVGGVYRESCLRPGWREVYGSAGRTAVALAAMGSRSRLHSYADAETLDPMSAHAAIWGFDFSHRPITTSALFEYTHSLSTPRIVMPSGSFDPIEVHADHVVRFGMLECEAVVRADQAVYDPQNAHRVAPFGENGSHANRLALVLNRHEANLMTGMHDEPVDRLAEALVARGDAQVVVIKQGPVGAHVREGARAKDVPAFRSGSVWKIGSGDNFVAHFAHHWMTLGRTAADSALFASQATAIYCGARGFASERDVESFSMPAIRPSARFVSGRKPKVYLAGPFFSLAQVWLVQEARQALRSVGLEVFSPYHDVGHGSAADVVSKDLKALAEADILFAISDGLDSGTMYEIGYANALNKPAVIYCENESDESLKMMTGAGCEAFSDFVTAIYTTVWKACEL